jgi:hypothetical protein
MTLKLWFLFILTAIAGLILIEAFLRRGRRKRSLSEKFGAYKDKAEDSVPLGMEELDMDMIRETEHLNRTIDDRSPRRR